MPTAQDDWKIRVPCLDGPRNFDGLPDHRTGHKRYSQTQSVARFFQYALFVIWSDSGIDQAYLIACAQQRCGNRQNTERRRGFRASKRWEEKHNLSGLGQRPPPHDKATPLSSKPSPAENCPDNVNPFRVVLRRREHRFFATSAEQPLAEVPRGAPSQKSPMSCIIRSHRLVDCHGIVTEMSLHCAVLDIRGNDCPMFGTRGDRAVNC